MKEKLPTIKQIKKWVKKKRGYYFYNDRREARLSWGYYRDSFGLHIRGTIKQMRRVCAALMDADKWEWQNK